MATKALAPVAPRAGHDRVSAIEYCGRGQDWRHILAGQDGQPIWQSLFFSSTHPFQTIKPGASSWRRRRFYTCWPAGDWITTFKPLAPTMRQNGICLLI